MPEEVNKENKKTKPELPKFVADWVSSCADALEDGIKQMQNIEVPFSDYRSTIIRSKLINKKRNSSTREEFQREEEDNLVLKSIKNLKEGTINPKLFDQLIERHNNFKGHVESNLTPENVLVGYSCFINNPDGSPKVYGDEKLKLIVFEITDANQLELEGYLNNHCVGREGQNYKKGLRDGTLAFFSIGLELDEPKSIVDIIREYGGGTNEFGNAVRENPDLAEIKSKRVSLITVEYQKNTGKISQIKFNTNRIMDRREYESLYKQIIRDLYFAINERARKINKRKVWSEVRSFGADLEGLNIPDRFLNIEGEDLTLKQLLESKKQEIIIAGNEIEVPSDITKEDFKKLCNLSNVTLRLPNVYFKSELFDEEWSVRGNLRYIEGNFSVIKPIDFSKLKSVGGSLELNSEFYSENLNFMKLTNVGGDIDASATKNLMFPVLEKIGENLDTRNSKNLSLENLEVIGGSLLCRTTENLNLKKLRIIDGSLFTENKTDLGLVSLETIMDEINAKGAENLNLPKLKEIGGQVDISDSRDVNMENLENIEGNLKATYSTRIKLSKLKLVGGSAIISYAININLEQLGEIGGDLIAMSTQDIDFKSLKRIANNLKLEASNNLTFPSLKVVQASIGMEESVDINFPVLTMVRKHVAAQNSENLNFSKLEEVNVFEAEGSINLDLSSLNWASIVRTSKETENLKTNPIMDAKIKDWNKTM